MMSNCVQYGVQYHGLLENLYLRVSYPAGESGELVGEERLTGEKVITDTSPPARVMVTPTTAVLLGHHGGPGRDRLSSFPFVCSVFRNKSISPG